MSPSVYNKNYFISLRPVEWRVTVTVTSQMIATPNTKQYGSNMIPVNGMQVFYGCWPNICQKCEFLYKSYYLSYSHICLYIFSASDIWCICYTSLIWLVGLLHLFDMIGRIHQVRSYGRNIAVNIWWNHWRNKEIDLSKCAHRETDKPITEAQFMGWGDFENRDEGVLWVKMCPTMHYFGVPRNTQSMMTYKILAINFREFRSKIEIWE